MAKPTARTTFSELALPRRSLYAWLTRAFGEPPVPSGRPASLSGAAPLTQAAPLFGVGFGKAFAKCLLIEEDGGAQAHELRREYMNLFKVPGGQYVTPYEAVYRDAREIDGQPVTGLLAGKSTVDVQIWYRLAAVEITEEFKDLPDHIALELNYLAHLCYKEQQFAKTGDEAHLTRTWEMERDFLAGHVVKWIGLLRDKIADKSKLSYYRDAAEIAVEFTHADLTALEGLLGPSGGHSTPRYGDIGA